MVVRDGKKEASEEEEWDDEDWDLEGTEVVKEATGKSDCMHG